jgi:hypothetical protein
MLGKRIKSNGLCMCCKKLRLDFCAPPSCHAAMTRQNFTDTELETVRELFAQITMLAEDIAERAVQGQHPGLTREETVQTCQHIRKSIYNLEIALKHIEKM